jgi:hypothetical protein
LQVNARGEKEPLPRRFECFGQLLRIGTDHSRILGNEVPAENLLRKEPEITRLE